MTERFHPSHEGQPFNEGEAPFVGSEFIKAIDGRPDKLLRVLPLDSATPDELQESLEVFQRGEHLFEMLGSRYGTHIPHMETEIKRDADGSVKAFTKVDRIEGFDISEAKKLPGESAAGLDSFYGALAKHYGDVLKEGGDFWFDFRNDQLMYGHAAGDAEKFVYMVDVDPEYQVYDKEQKGQGKRLLRLIARINESILEVEKKLPDHVFLKEARKVLQEIINNIPEDEPGYDQFIEKLKGIPKERRAAA